MEPILTPEETEAIYEALNSSRKERQPVEEVTLVDGHGYIATIKETWNAAGRRLKSDMIKILTSSLGVRVELDITEPSVIVPTKSDNEEWDNERVIQFPLDSQASHIVAVNAADKYLYICIDQVIARHYLQKRIGSNFDPNDLEQEPTALTLLERRILTDLIESIMKAACTVSPNNEVLSVSNEDPIYLWSKRPPSETWVIMNFAVASIGSVGISILGPASFFLEIPDGTTNLISNRLENTPVQISVELGRTVLLVSDVLKLQPGMFLPLNVAKGDPFRIMIAGIPKLKGEPLVSRGNIAVQVIDRLSSGEI